MAEVSTLSMEAARSEVVVVAPPQQQVSGRTWAALAILCLGAFLVVLDTTIVNIAIPSIMTGLHSSLDQVLWVLNAYTLVYAALLITGGRLGDLYGPRRLLIVGILVFGGASVACALAPSAGILIAARVLQGVGGGLMTPQTLALIPAIVPANRRGRAIGLWSGSAGLAAAGGPFLGGGGGARGGGGGGVFLRLPRGGRRGAGAPGSGRRVDDSADSRVDSGDRAGQSTRPCDRFVVGFGGTGSGGGPFARRRAGHDGGLALGISRQRACGHRRDRRRVRTSPEGCSRSPAPAGHRWDCFGEPGPAGGRLRFGRGAALCLGHDHWADHHPRCHGRGRRLARCICSLGAASTRAAVAARAFRVAQFHRVRMGDPRHPDSDAGLHRGGGPVLPVRAADDRARRRTRAGAGAALPHSRRPAGGPARWEGGPQVRPDGGASGRCI